MTKRLASIAFWSALALAVGAALMPVLWMVVTSVKTPAEFVAESLDLLPDRPTLDNYRSLWEQGFLAPFLNSVLVTGGATLLSLAAAFPAAYGLVRFRFPARLDQVFLILILVVKLLPPIAVAIPLYQMLREAGLLNTLPGLILVYQIFTLPFALWMLLGFIRDIPLAVEEAAALDGAGTGRILLTIVLPLAAPGLVATAVFTAVLAWNEFLFALLTIQTPSRFPLPVAIATLITEDETLWGRLTAIGFLASLPILLVLGYLQRWLLRGFAASA